MRLKRLLFCLAVEASEKSTSDEIQGRGFGISDSHTHATTTIQTSINHATDNLQTCLELGGVWNAMAVNPYCALPIAANTIAPTPAHRSSEQAKLDCLQGGHYWIADQNGGGFSYCSWSAPATQATLAPPSSFESFLTITADSFDNENECENNGFYWHQFPTYGYCDEQPKAVNAFNNPQMDCMDNNGRWIPQIQICEMACSQCEGTCSTDLVCVCGNGQYGQNCEYCYAGFLKVVGSGCIRVDNKKDCSDETNCNGRGTCSEENGVKSCTCFAGFSGAKCENDVRPDPCRDILNNCNGRGTCTTGSMGIHMCSCYSGYTGSRCENKIQTDPCINNVCNSRGSCSSRLVNGNLIAECACYSGFSGRFCTDNVVQVDPCIALSFCNENGYCVRNRDRTTATCQCNQGWTGDTCLTRQRITCKDLNFCNNAGDCITSNGGDSRCQCYDKFDGDRCQVEKQDSRCIDQSFCSNGGVCMETTTTKYCICPDGYEGAQCQYAPGTPKCDYTNCNNGDCDYNIDGEPFCVCDNGWKGPYCEIAIPCMRDCPFGKCAHGKNAQYCADCPDNFFGRECKYDCTACGTDEICEKTSDSDGNVISARCAVKPVSVCEASNICLNGCECIDSVKDGYYFTCKNAPNNNFLGKRCQWNEPILKCGTDSIEIEITNSFHENFSFSKKTYSIGSFIKATDENSPQTQLIISKNDNPDVFRTRVVDGSLVMSSDVVLSLAQDNNPSFFSKMRVMTFACKYSIGEVISDAFSPASWPSETLVENNVNFNVDLKFYSVDATYEAHRLARESAFVLHGEDVYVSAGIHDSVDNLPSDINLYYENCDLRQNDVVIPVIANGCPVINNDGRQSFADVSFYTAQPTNGIEFKMTVLGFQKEALKLTCEVSFCTMGNCNTDYCNGRRRRAISRPTIQLEVSPIYILAPQAENYEGQQINLS